MTGIIERMTRSRIVYVSKVGATLSLIALVAAFVAPSSPFLAKLIAWFGFFLFVFHWIFGAARKLTATQVRLIDYMYLVIAAIGMFVLALNYGEKREDYLQAEHMDKLIIRLQVTRVQLGERASDLRNASCEPTIVQLMPLYCEQGKELIRTLKIEAPREEREAVIAHYLESAPPPDATDALRSQAYRKIENQIWSLRAAQLAVTNDELSIKLDEPLPKDAREYAYGLFTWPFILAFAFALRITKTTIEVFDWAASKQT